MPGAQRAESPRMVAADNGELDLAARVVYILMAHRSAVTRQGPTVVEHIIKSPSPQETKELETTRSLSDSSWGPGPTASEEYTRAVEC